jgi:large exoprotein involved in heme utilization and adhesion
LLYLRQSEITSTVHGARGNGGNIAIAAQNVVLDRSQILAKAVLGHGGNIVIGAGEFIKSPDSLISASSELGISGAIEIEGPRVDLNGSLVVLPSDLRAAAAILPEACIGYGGRPRSSLSSGGGTGVPPDLDLPAPALYLGGRDRVPLGSGASLANESSAPFRLAVRCE